MLYNQEKHKVQEMIDCEVCHHFDARLKKCNGIGKCCLEYDPVTNTAIDPITRLAIKIK